MKLIYNFHNLRDRPAFFRPQRATQHARLAFFDEPPRKQEREEIDTSQMGNSTFSQNSSQANGACHTNTETEFH